MLTRCSWWLVQAFAAFELLPFSWNSPALCEEWWEPFIGRLQTFDVGKVQHAGLEGRIHLARSMRRSLARCSWWLVQAFAAGGVLSSHIQQCAALTLALRQHVGCAYPRLIPKAKQLSHLQQKVVEQNLSSCCWRPGLTHQP